MNDILVRALKTFVQAFVPVLIADISAIQSGIVTYGWDNWQAWLMPIIIPAISAGLSALWNYLLSVSEQKKTIEKAEDN